MSRQPRMNLTKIQALVVDSDEFSVSILSQMLRGFGLTDLVVAPTGDGAKTLMEKRAFDLLFCEMLLADMPGADLVRWIRAHDSKKVKYLPILMLTGHTQMSKVAASRDSGANIVVRKPMAATVLYDRLVWSINSPRERCMTILK